MSKPRPAAKPNPHPPSGNASLSAGPTDRTFQIFMVAFGVFLALALLKFPNPPIMAKLVETPTNEYEWLLSAWPVTIAYWLLAAVAGCGLFAWKFPAHVPKWLLALPLAWLAWQCISATQTVDTELTRATMKHFTACAVCFYLGAFCLGRDRHATWFWLLLVAAFGFVIFNGFQQHFGGLEATRRHFWTYIYPELKDVPPEYLKKVNSTRIFSTLFYPNALAGALLLLLPVSLVLIWQDFTRFTRAARGFLAGAVGVGAMGCLFWSGSKGGWLLMLVLGAIALLYAPIPKKIKLCFIAGVLVFGLAGFALKYAGYFERKATSVSARFDYWQAAGRTLAANPVFGTGPGTFAIPYQKIKRPESEMARLTHNDYLQQASDSGVIGFITYAALVVGVLIHARPGKGRGEALHFAVWLGLLGLALQGLLEFGLYVPALAWCGFAMMGWLLTTTAKRIDKPEPTS